MGSSVFATHFSPSHFSSTVFSAASPMIRSWGLPKSLPYFSTILAALTVMVQEEVARRMQAGPGTKDYGALSMAVQYYAEPSIKAFVPPNCFIPRPGVGSAVILLKRRPEPRVAVQDPAQMFAMIRAGFGQRRKTLVNSLSGSPELSLTKEEAQNLLLEAGLSPLVRGEALTLEQFAELSDLWTQKEKTETERRASIILRISRPVNPAFGRLFMHCRRGNSGC